MHSHGHSMVSHSLVSLQAEVALLLIYVMRLSVGNLAASVREVSRERGCYFITRCYRKQWSPSHHQSVGPISLRVKAQGFTVNTTSSSPLLHTQAQVSQSLYAPGITAGHRASLLPLQCVNLRTFFGSFPQGIFSPPQISLKFFFVPFQVPLKGVFLPGSYPFLPPYLMICCISYLPLSHYETF